LPIDRRPPRNRIVSVRRLIHNPGAVLVLLWANLAAVAAPCDSTASCLQAIEAAQRETKTVSARFVQTKHLNLLAEPLVSRGRFLFKRPDRIAWKVEEPQAVTVIIDAQGIHVPGMAARDRQALAMVPANALSSQLGAMFSGTTSALEGEFAVTARDDGGAIRVHLVPRREDTGRLFRTVDLLFPPPFRFVQQIMLEDAVGDRVEIALEDVRLNVDVPDTEFAVEDASSSP
jgi:outer membrane lipoprotein-sorting protein